MVTRSASLAVGLVLFSASAHAQAPAADTLFEQAKAALAKGDVAVACERFRMSDQLEPAGGTRAHLGDCYEKLGKVANAWEAFRSALKKLPASDKRVPKIKARIEALEARLPRLKLVLAADAPKDTTVREGDVVIGNAATYGIAIPFDPGVHHFVATAPGYAARAFDATVDEGETATISVRPGAATNAPPYSAHRNRAASPCAFMSRATCQESHLWR